MTLIDMAYNLEYVAKYGYGHGYRHNYISGVSERIAELNNRNGVARDSAILDGYDYFSDKGLFSGVLDALCGFTHSLGYVPSVVEDEYTLFYRIVPEYITDVNYSTSIPIALALAMMSSYHLVYMVHVDDAPIAKALGDKPFIPSEFWRKETE